MVCMILDTDAHMLIRRYVGNEEATKSAFLGDWLRTGDIMRRDEKGTFWLTDRYREVGKDFICPYNRQAS